MVNHNNTSISIYPAIAAVLVAAAFAFLCLVSPLTVFAFDTKTACNSLLDGVVSANNLNSATSSSSAMLMYYDPSGDLNIRVYNNPTVTSNNSTQPYYTSIGGYYYSGYYNDNGYNNGTGLGSGGFIVYSDKIVLVRNNGATVDMPFSATTGYHVAGYSVPESCASDYAAQSAYNTIYEQANLPSNPQYKWSLYSPMNNGKTLGQTISTDYKSAVDKGLTTTTTTTATTTTATTTTAQPLPTYPFQTNPPFELPSEWLGDYSETVPVPSVPSVTTVDVSGYDDILSDAENNFVSAIGFWFLAMKDFFSLNPTITYLAVFTIAIVLIILLLYNKGDDS